MVRSLSFALAFLLLTGAVFGAPPVGPRYVSPPGANHYPSSRDTISPRVAARMTISPRRSRITCLRMNRNSITCRSIRCGSRETPRLPVWARTCRCCRACCATRSRKSCRPPSRCACRRGRRSGSTGSGRTGPGRCASSSRRRWSRERPTPTPSRLAGRRAARTWNERSRCRSAPREEHGGLHEVTQGFKLDARRGCCGCAAAPAATPAVHWTC